MSFPPGFSRWMEIFRRLITKLHWSLQVGKRRKLQIRCWTRRSHQGNANSRLGNGGVGHARQIHSAQVEESAQFQINGRWRVIRHWNLKYLSLPFSNTRWLCRRPFPAFSVIFLPKTFLTQPQPWWRWLVKMNEKWLNLPLKMKINQ